MACTGFFCSFNGYCWICHHHELLTCLKGLQNHSRKCRLNQSYMYDDELYLSLLTELPKSLNSFWSCIILSTANLLCNVDLKMEC